MSARERVARAIDANKSIDHHHAHNTLLAALFVLADELDQRCLEAEDVKKYFSWVGRSGASNKTDE